MMEAIDVHSAATPPVRKPVVDLTEHSPSTPAGDAGGSKSSKSGQYYYSNSSYGNGSQVPVYDFYAGGNNVALGDGRDRANRAKTGADYDLSSFGSSIPSKSKKPSASAYSSYIKPATPNAFRQEKVSQPKQTFARSAHQPAFGSGGYVNGWPSWVQPGGANPFIVPNPRPAIAPPKPANQDDDVPREAFNIDSVPITADDYTRYNGDAEKHMQELLSGAIGDGEDEMGDDGMKEGEDTVEGFAKGIKLMPHQVRGVRWMKQRETGRKYGGILADDMGLGKTVQTLARIVEGKPTAAEKKAGYKAGTLIVAPLAVMEQWATECRTKTEPGRLKVTTHHGPSRTKSGKTLEGFDVVITTFQTLASEFGVKKAPKKKATMSALFDVKWLRIVVVEGEVSMVFDWNNVEELFSLFQFLRAKPLDDWHVFKERISSLVKDGRTKLAMKRLHVVLKAIMLRRTKDAEIDGKKILNLPGRTVQVLPCAFDADERAFYDALEQKTTLTFNKFVKSGTANANYTSVLTLLLRLRQACVHPSLVTKSLDTDVDAITDAVSKSSISTAPEKDEADELADLLGGLGVAKGKTCQMCFVKLDDNSAQYCDACEKIAHRVRRQSGASEDALPPTSAKIRMLLKLLSEIDEKSGNKEKTIVFSQFTSFLDLVEPFLKKYSIKYVRYDGSMRNDHRQESLAKIRDDPKTRVILISFKAGSTGLNLTCCNNVILMDLWWNPALEDQAFDRAHRLGQKLDVNIWKLTIEETVEDRILILQNSKRDLANAALSGQTGKGVMKLTMDDIMSMLSTLPCLIGH
uniref:Helicase C-terminal domain-containing protein n=1 Tax=Cryptococcus bacillisporus CA1280 TaxID=1296109 RepID=A0A0D0UC75_CRYGA|nr:hypothetical protein I312_04893 [Cryptococcus bacillisporus CA1280]